MSFVNLEELKPWDRNPRDIDPADLKRLCMKIERYGQIVPLIVTADGTVIGGNMRYRAMTEMGWEEAWVSVVEAETDEDKLRYALSDNDHVGRYVQERVTGLLAATPIDQGLFRFSAGRSADLQGFLSLHSPPSARQQPEAGQEPSEPSAGQEPAYIFRIVLSYLDEDFKRTFDGLAGVISRNGLTNNTEAVKHLLEKHCV